MVDRKSIHHLVPKSRLPECQIQRLNHLNTSCKPSNTHKAWHDVFLNLTPFEILIFYLTEIRKDDLIEAEIVSDWEGVISESFSLGKEYFNINFFECKKEKFYILKNLLKGDRKKFSFLNVLVRHWTPSNYFYFINILDHEERRFEYYSPEIKLSSNMV